MVVIQLPQPGGLQDGDYLSCPSASDLSPEAKDALIQVLNKKAMRDFLVQTAQVLPLVGELRSRMAGEKKEIVVTQRYNGQPASKPMCPRIQGVPGLNRGIQHQDWEGTKQMISLLSFIHSVSPHTMWYPVGAR